MKKLLLAGISSVAVMAAAPAGAADLSVKAPAAPVAQFSWTGCYVGAHVGFGWAKFDDTQGFRINGVTTTYNTGFNSDVTGSIFGGQLGCNYQVAPTFVLGVEGSISGSGMNGFDYAAPVNNCCFAWFKTDDIASVTGRIGWTGWDPRVMFYAKGGAAWARDEFMFSYALAAHQTRTGWTLGFGVEWNTMIFPNWSLFAEYDRYGFGTKNVPNCGSNSGCSSVDVRHNIDTVRVGANYRFNLIR